MVMEKLLEKLRCRTITVSNGAEALRYAMSEIKFDIIMMEFKLPQINGADVARMIRETKNANAHTPIVAVTGYLKELQAPHHFDALIEKPPTTSKLTDAMCRLCQWKAPMPGQTTALPNPYPQPSGLRQESLRWEDSPTSTSSYAHMPGSSFRGSSREDSMSSSMFGDSESFMHEDVPVVISRKATDDWDEPSGLGISHDESLLDSNSLPKPLPPHLLAEESAPARMEITHKIPIRQRSSEKMKAKRETMEKNRHECGESGDDEDDELGDVNVKEKSPRSATKIQRGSKLGIEMMRTNSRGSVVSTSDITQGADSVAPPPTVVEEIPHTPMVEDIPHASEITGATLTPPEVFMSPGEKVFEIDMDETPRPSSTQHNPLDDEPTPRAPLTASDHTKT
jgi:serine/threonine-protein kinase RIM15